MISIRKYAVSIIVIISLLLGINTTIFAKGIDATTNASTNEIKKGQEITITLNLKEQEKNSKNITAYKATFSYDTNVFETVTSESFVPQNNWERLIYNDKTGELVSINKIGEIANGNVLKVKLIAKQDVNVENTIISFKDITVSNGKIDMTTENNEIPLNIKVISDNPSNNQSDDNQTNNNTNSNKSEVSQKPIPNTGLMDDNFHIVIIGQAIILGLVLVIIRKKTKSKKIFTKQSTIICILGVLVISMQIGGVVYANSQKGDIDQNLKIDYDDVTLLQKHLINQSYIENDLLNIADLNSDNKITVTDLAILVQKIENTLDYSFEIKPEALNKYYEKGEDFKLIFSANVPYDAYITSVLINDQEYTVAKDEHSNVYSVALKAQNKAGVQSFKITKAKLNVKKEIDVKFEEKIEVLKGHLSVKNYKATDNYDKQKISFDFEIEDNDNAFESGMFELVKENGGVYKKFEISQLKNHFDVDVIDMEKYTLNIYSTYYRSSNKEIEEKDKLLFTAPVQLVTDYNITVSNMGTYNNQNIQTKYFNKNEDIKLRFNSENKTSFYPIKAIINSKEYDVVKLQDNLYEVLLNSYNESGVKSLKIEKIILNNTKELKISENNSTKFEILKEKPSINNFSYNNDKYKLMQIDFTLNDDEHTVSSAKIEVLDKSQNLIYNQNVVVGDNSFNVTLSDSEDYTIKVIADYDLDTNGIQAGDNEYKSAELYKTSVSVTEEMIEFKDIENVELYTKNQSDVELVNKINVNSFNPKEYIAKVNMKNLPSFYAEIEKGEVAQNGDFNLQLKYENTVTYNGDKKLNKLVVKYGKVDNSVVENLSFEEIIKRVRDNPNATIKLTNDIDASKVRVQTPTYLQEFSGTFDGNGYRIKNLDRALFTKLKNATVKNLVIENATIKSNNGIIAGNADSTSITNVHIINSRVERWNSEGVGGFVGNVTNNSKISNSSANNIFVQSYKYIGGLTGKLDNSTIENCYIKGTVKAGFDASGGIIGQSHNGYLLNSYADINFNSDVNWASAGLVGYTGSKITLKNNISLAVGDKGYRTFGNSISNDSINNYEIKDTKLVRINSDKVKEIDRATITEEFIKTNLNWDLDVWDIKNTNGDNMPTLKNDDPTNSANIQTDEKPQTEGVYIPQLKRIRTHKEYNQTNEVAYHNINKLIPYLDANFIVEYGNKIAGVEPFNTEKIDMILPYDENNNFITALTNKNVSTISKLKIVFENKAKKEYSVSFKRQIGDIAVYNIGQLGVSYTYKGFILNQDINVVNEIINKASKLDYQNEIASVTQTQEGRLYVDYYNETAVKKLQNAVLSILANSPQLNVYLDNEIVKTKILNDLNDNKELEKLIYSYNYFDKWYGIEMDNTRLSDLLFLSAPKIKDDLSIDDLVNIVMTNDIGTSNTARFYENGLKSIFSGKSLKEFLEHYISVLTDAQNPQDWFKDNFKGILNEQGVKGKETQIRYRAWDIMNSRNHLVLPILTAPQEDMYLISVPSQLIIGSMNRYSQHYQPDKTAMEKLIEEYAVKISNFYSTSSQFINNSAQILNTHAHIQYDTRFNFPDNAPTPGKQEKGKTQDPVIKWVYEAIDAWPAENGSGAYANGTDVYWVANTALGGDYSFFVFSHETAHNQDGYYFYEGYGRRSNTGAEDHADGNISQQIFDGSFLFNLRGDISPNSDVSNNLTLERISSKEKIKTYYKEMYDAYYLLDYLTAQAFLKLTPYEQSRIATKVYHQKGVEPDYDIGGANSYYTAMSEQDFKNMNLSSMEDLWNNGIVFRGVGEAQGNGMYGGDNHYNVYWYQPHNNNGRPDSYSFKKLGFEMLGFKGYSDGYVTYRSGKSKNDLDALRKITNDPNITYKDYKLARFEEVKNNLSSVSFFNVDDVINAYVKAMKEDAKATDANKRRDNANNLRKVLYGVIKRATKDFTTGGVFTENETTKINSADELINAINKNVWGNYELVNDIDFTNINTDTDTYITKEFIGRLNGNGYSINGLSKTLFDTITYAEIDNVIIEAPRFDNSAKAILANNSKNSLIYKVNVNSSNLNLPFVSQKTQSLQVLDSNINVRNNIITNKQEFLDLINSTQDIDYKASYVLGTDLDLSDVAIDRDSIFKNIFYGTIDGNGYTLSNLKKPLFNQLNGLIKNVKINNSNVGTQSENYVAVIARKTENATIQNIKLNNAVVNGRDNIGVVSGYSKNSNFNKIEITDMRVNGYHYYAGGLIGRSYNSVIENVLISGDMQVKETHNGGFIGGVNNDRLVNVYSNINITKISGVDSRNKNAGLYGAIESGNISVSNAIVTGNMANNSNPNNNLFKVTPATNDNEVDQITKYLSNVYEDKNTSGKANSEVNTNILAVEKSQYNTKDFYVNVLKFPESVWDFSNIQNGLPTLKIK